MDLTKEELQRKEFTSILFDLSKSQDLLQDAKYRSNMYKRLETLYDAEPPKKRFRHFYTDIFSVLTQVQQNPQLGDINILGQNLDIIRKGYNPKNSTSDGRVIDVSDAINKLYDHVNLDIARIAYSDGADRKISGEATLEDIQSQINLQQEKAQELKEAYQSTENKINDVKAKLSNSQKEYITILGIFAAVVLAFTGGIAFSTSVLNNIAQASIYRTVFITLLIGFVLINVLFGLFYYINSLVDKGRKIYPLFVSNIIIVILLFLTVIAWHFGWVENRNTRINDQKNVIENTAYIEKNNETVKIINDRLS